MSCTDASHAALKASPEAWTKLAYRGVQEVVAGADPIVEPAYRLELRNCPCGSTLAKPVVEVGP